MASSESRTALPASPLAQSASAPPNQRGTLDCAICASRKRALAALLGASLCFRSCFLGLAFRLHGHLVALLIGVPSFALSAASRRCASASIRARYWPRHTAKQPATATKARAMTNPTTAASEALLRRRGSRPAPPQSAPQNAQPPLLLFFLGSLAPALLLRLLRPPIVISAWTAVAVMNSRSAGSKAP